MNRSVPHLIFFTLIPLLFVACQGISGDPSTPKPDFEPIASIDANQTTDPALESDSQDYTAGTKTFTPVFTPTIDHTDESMSQRSANADVEYVKAVQATDGTWTFHVTVRHPDTGWEDYADGWDVLTPNGTVLKPDVGSQFTRTLLHPHVEEQPVTRGQSRIVIP